MEELGIARSRVEGEARLTTASGASYVEAVNGDVEVFFVCGFFSGIELAAFVDVLAARHAYILCKLLLFNPVVPMWACRKHVHFMEKGAMRRTVITLGPTFLGTRDLVILDGSKSGG